jgi:acetoin utilization deacetylase AcuC-like enzyme
MTILLVDDPLFEQHRAPSGGHPERPERLRAARSAIARAGAAEAIQRLEARDATDDVLLRVHRPVLVEQLARAAGHEGYFDADTYYCGASVAAARRAAGGSVALVDALLSRRAAPESAQGLALVRPPGHHARPGAAMGFCLINNVAVAAAHALSQGAERIAIVDWDVHHGNGTQEIFYRDPAVLYVSLHQVPFYPGTGAAEEVGEGEGKGFTVNVPLSAGADDAVYLAAMDRLIAPVLAEYAPDLLLISAGFDAHERDPLAAMRLTAGAYAKMTRRLRRAVGSAPIGLVLEGGYDLTALADSLVATLAALTRPADETEAAGSLGATHERDLRRAEAAQRPYWGPY